MARYAPGLSPSELKRHTIPETNYLRARVHDRLDAEADERAMHTQAIMKQTAALGRAFGG